MDLKKQFRTDIWNHTQERINLVQDFYGKRRFTICPGYGWILGVWWMPFSAYSKVVYLENGEVELTKRFGFKRHFDKDQYTIKITNNHDRINNYGIGSLLSGSINVPKGITCHYPVHPLDYLANWSEIEILPDRVRYRPFIGGMSPVKPSGLAPGIIDLDEDDYRGRIVEPNLIYKKRSEAELKKIEKIRLKMHAEDTEYFKEFGLRSTWNMQKWEVTPGMLDEEGDKEKRRVDLETRLEEDKRNHQMNYTVYSKVD